MWCWGQNTTGQLGVGNDTDSLVPERVGTLPIAIDVSAGHDHTCACAVTTAETASRCGDSSVGELGDGALGGMVTTPVAVSGFTAFGGAVDSENAGSVCGITIGGAAVCWGWNGDGQLGDVSTTNTGVPTSVLGL